MIACAPIIFWLTNTPTSYQVCRKFKSIIDDSPSLQYVFELPAAGYKSGGGRAIADLGVAAFRRAQRAYRAPNIRVGAVKQLSCGPIQIHAHQWRASPKIVGDYAIFTHDDEDVLGILDLRSDVADGERFRLMSVPFRITKFFVSLAQDLLMLVEGLKLHFLSFSTGDIPDNVLAVHGDDMPILEDDLPDDVGFIESISITQDWILVGGVYDDGDAARFRALYRWPTGTKITVELLRY